MHHLFHQLTKEYPLSTSHFHKWRVSFSLGLFVFLFLAVFQPFGIDLIQDQKLWIIGGYGLITFLLTILNLSLVDAFFSEAKWALWKQILFNLWVLMTIAVANFYYTQQYNPRLGLHLINFVFHTLAVGIIPITLLLLYRQQRLYKKHWLESQQLNSSFTSLQQKPTSGFGTLQVQPANQEAKELDQQNILFIESVGNYLHIHHLNSDKAQLLKVRGTIKHILSKLDPSQFQKTHRAFIVNLCHIRKAEGNAQGLRLTITKSPLEVPVSRNFVKPLRQHIS